MFAVQKNVLHPDSQTQSILSALAQFSNNLFNVGTYLARQAFFENGQILPYAKIYPLAKTNENYGLLCAQAAQQTLKSVGESFTSFKKLVKLYKQGKLKDKPGLPRYRKKGGLFQIVYPGQAIKVVGDKVRIPLGKGGKAHFGQPFIYVPFPVRLHERVIRELRIIPKAGVWYVEYVTEQPDVANFCNLIHKKVLSIDVGVNNFVTAVTTTGKSLIIDGLKIKSMNQWYNKQVSRLKRVHDLQDKRKKKPLTRQLARLAERRNRRTRDFINKTARTLIELCKTEGITAIVFGHNEGQKNGSRMSKKANQEFVQLPHFKLKDRIASMCEQYGLLFVTTEESYTSKASFVDRDFLPKHGEKPESWKPSGRRVHRGLYRTGGGLLINADCNGAGKYP